MSGNIVRDLTGVFDPVTGAAVGLYTLKGTEQPLAAGTTPFSDVAAGIVPASGGGTTNFLRADGSFAPPPSGGATAYTGLSDAATATLPTTNTPLANALAAKLAASAGAVGTANLADSSVTSAKIAPIGTKQYLGRTSGGTGAVENVSASTLAADLAPVSISYSATIPLDSVQGKRMPQTSIASNTTLVLGASPVTDGYCELVVVGDGTHTLNIPAGWSRIGSAPDMGSGKRSLLAFTYLAIGEVVYAVTALSDLDVTAPTFGTPHIEDAAKTVIVVPMSETIGAVIPVAGDITLTSAGGRTVSSVAKSGSDINVTVSSAFAAGDAPSIAITSGKVSDVAGNLAGALATTAVTNNIVSTAKTFSNVQPWAQAGAGGAASVDNILTSVPIAGNFLFAFTSADDTTFTQAVTDNIGDSVPWNIGVTEPTPLNQQRIYFHWKQVGTPSGGLKTVTVTNTGGVGSTSIAVAEYAPSAPATLSLNGTATFANSSAGANPSCGAITTTHKGLVLAAVGHQAGASTAGSGFAVELTYARTGTNVIEDQFTTAGGAVTPAFVNADATVAWTMVAVAFKAL